MAKGTIGKIFFERSDGSSPISYERVCKVFSISGLGKTNSLEDVTTFCSAGDREFIGGLADGKTITVQMNYDYSDTHQTDLIGDVEDAVTGTYRLVDENTSPSTTFSFSAVAMDWELQPSVDSKNILSVQLKISGAITRGTLS